MDERIGRITKNSTVVFIARSIDLFVGIITVTLVARYLGVKEFGTYAFLIAVAMVLSTVVTFGSFRILIREMSINLKEIPNLLFAGLSLNGLMAIVILFLATLVALFFNLGSKEAIISLYVASFTEIIKAIIRTFVSVFMAYEKMGYDTLISVFSGLLTILFIFIAIYANLGLIGFFAAEGVACCAGLFLAFWVANKKFIKILWEKNIRQLKYLLKESAPIALSVFLSQGYTYLNVFILKILTDTIEIAHYQAPQRIILPLLIIPRSFLLAFVPSLSRMANIASASGLEYAYSKLLKFAIIISLFISMWGTIFPEYFITFIFGKEFLGATKSFQIQIWILVPLFANLLIDFTLTSMNRQRVLVISNLLAFLTTIITGYSLISMQGNVGASWAALISSMVLFAVNFYFVSKFLIVVPFHSIFLRPLIGAGLTAILFYRFAGGMNIVISSLFGFLMYIGFLFLMKTFSADEINIFKQMVGKFHKY